MELRKKSAFISRNLKRGSAFRQILEARGIEVSGRSLIRFEAVPFQLVPDADWIFFYSPRGVRYFFQQLPPNKLWKSTQFAAIGPATARVAEKYVGTCDFVGTGEPATTAEDFLEAASGHSVLFPQARHSRQSVQRLINGAITASSLVVYDNQPISAVPALYVEVLAFTSPLNARIYFKYHQVQAGQWVVAIGEPTAAACRAEKILPVVSEKPSESGLAEAVLSCIR